MGKPDDIPSDIWDDAASKALEYVEWLIPAPHDYAGSEDVLTKVIARAIMAERERCAEEANGVDPKLLEGKSERFVSIYCAARVDAAKAIRGEAA